MCAKTTIAASETFKKNTMWLNGEEVPFEDNPRLLRCLKAIKSLALAKGGNVKFPLDWKLHVVSHNNFPTAAGLASSAAGYACLVYTLACLYGVETEELTAIARQGSGSACRSLHGGFVQWHMGKLHDGSDSLATIVKSCSYWPDMHVLILVVNDARKKTASTKGMQRSVETSELLQYRAKQCVPKRIVALKKAIEEHDFETFAGITMRDSNQFHAVALDTFPPCVYMNDVSHAIIEFVHSFNATAGRAKVAYTFDAGPNACLYVLQKDVANLLHALQQVFPNDNESSVEYLKGIPIDNMEKERNDMNGNFCFTVNVRNLLKYIIHTKIGAGPERLDREEGLINSHGLPL